MNDMKPWRNGDDIYQSDVMMRAMAFHQRIECLLNRLFRPRSKKTSKLRVTGLYEGNPPVTVGFPSQKASNAEKVSIWWRHHAVESGYITPKIQ